MARRRRIFWATVALLLAAPMAHPTLIPVVGVASHLLWWIHVLPVAMVTYRTGRGGGAVLLAASAVLVVLGERSSVRQRVIERLYGNSSRRNDRGQYAYYGKVGGCVVTGNEDGVLHGSMGIPYSLQHLGYTVPHQADAGWVGEAGPGPSYLDEGSGGPENDFTQRNTTFMTWNLLHLARMLRDRGGIPAHGNQRSEWDAGGRFDHPKPEHR